MVGVVVAAAVPLPPPLVPRADEIGGAGPEVALEMDRLIKGVDAFILFDKAPKVLVDCGLLVTFNFVKSMVISQTGFTAL